MSLPIILRRSRAEAFSKLLPLKVTSSAVTLPGAQNSYTLPEVANEEDKTTSKDRNLLAIITVKVKGKNGTEAVEPFAMLVGKAGP